MKNTAKKSTIVLAAILMFAIAMVMISPVSAAGTLVKAEATPSQPEIDDTLTVNIKILDAQGLFGLDLKLNWNPSVLQLQSATHQLGVETHAGGVLHESTAYPIEIVADEVSQESAQYHLSATSTGASTPSFNGNGVIATITFKVVGTGSTGIVLAEVELAQLNLDGTTDLVEPQTTVDPIDPAIPEFPTVIIIVLLIGAATATVIASTKILKRNNATFKPTTL